MERTLARDLPAHIGERVRVAGWLQHRRELSRVTFVLVRDRSGVAQVVVDDNEQALALRALPAESVILVDGIVAAAEQVPLGAELTRPTFQILATALEPPPVELHRRHLKEALPTLLDHAPVALRHPTRRALFDVAAASMAGFRTALDAHGFIEIQTPKIVGSATESGATVFKLDYFGRAAYLAQSPQFYKQTMVGVFERVYEVGPVFRAEPHDTPRHLSEYVSLDAELGFIHDHRDVMRIAQVAITGMVDTVASRAGNAVALLGLRIPTVPSEIPSIDFEIAQEMIHVATGEEIIGEPDLAPAHERWLGDWASREHGSDFLFVTGYPMAKRPFYTKPDPARPRVSNSFDLLFRGLELLTGGERLHRYEDYVAALRAKGEDPAQYLTYLEAFRHGMPAHGGFAIGLERWVARLAGVANVRETTLFPRDLNRLSP